MILLMYSGGLDSTGALFKLLTESQEPLHVHHIILKNHERRWVAEQFATTNVIKYCKEHYRDFKYTTNVYEFEQFQKFIGWDNDIVRFIAAQICRDNTSINQLALGKCADDDVDPVFNVRSLQAMTIWKACFIDTPINTPEIIRPVEKLTKKQIWELLPKDLRTQVWSCRTPTIQEKTISYCFKCKTCLQLIHHGLLTPAPTKPEKEIES